MVYSLLSDKNRINNISRYDNKKQILLVNETRKRYNSDNNKFILNNSLNKLYKNDYFKFKL